MKTNRNKLIKYIVRLRMWYADLRGHHGKKWNYEPGDHYMGRSKKRRKLRVRKMMIQEKWRLQ